MKLDENKAEPLYTQLENLLKAKLENGDRQKGDKLPTEMELSEKFKVSRITVRKALGSLVQQGLIVKRSGKGTFVSNEKIQRPLSGGAISFTSLCEAQGLIPGAKTIKSVLEPPTPKDREVLGLTENDRVISIERIRSADGTPVSVEVSHFTEDLSFLLDEDLTNASLLYRRNQVRHQLLPLLRQLQPSADQAVATTIANLQSVERLYSALLQPLRQQLVQTQPDGTVRVSLRLDSLGALLPNPTDELRAQLLFELLRPYGFNAPTARDILACRTPGRRFLSATHCAYLDRAQLLLVPLGQPQPDAMPRLTVAALPAAQSTIDYRHLPANQALFDAATVRQPLTLRHWRPADRFQPLGMQQGSQLVSDFFSDHKYSPIDKQRQLLLVDADDTILWIVGRRTAHPCRVTPSSATLLLVTVG